MKKNTLLLLLISLLISGNLFSQKKLEFGFYAGTSITSILGAKDYAKKLTNYESYYWTDVAYQMGYNKIVDFPVKKSNRNFLINGGGFVSYNITPGFGLKLGIEYAPKGVWYTGEGYIISNLNMQSDVVKYSECWALGYIDFPLTVQLSTRSTANPDNVFFYVNLGVSPAVKAFANKSIEEWEVERSILQSGMTSDNTVQTFISSKETMTDINDFDLGLVGSMGVGSKHFFFDVKYNKGMKNIFTNSSDGDYKNNLFAMCLGVKF